MVNPEIRRGEALPATDLPIQAPTPIITRATSAVSHCFTMIGSWFLKVLECVIDPLPTRAAYWLDRKRLIVETILEIPHDQRAPVLERLLPIIFPNMTQEKQASLIHLVNPNNPQSQNELLRFIRYDTYSPDIADIIFSIREAVPDVNNRADVIHTIATVPAGQRADVISHAFPLFTPQMNEWHRFQIMRDIAAVPEDQRADVIKHARLLFTPEMDGGDRPKIICFINMINQNLREDLIARALPLLTPQMNGGHRAEIINAISAVPADERDDVITRAERLFTHQMDGRDRAEIIQAISAVPADQRDDVIARSQPLFTLQMNRGHRAEIIYVIAKVPADQRDDVITRADRLFTLQMHAWDKAHIIKAIARVPADQRDDVIALSQLLFTPHMHGEDKARIIEAIARVPAAERAAYVAARRQGHFFQNAAVAAQGGVNVHEGGRDQGVKDAVVLLRGHQGRLVQDSIDGAVGAFIAYLSTKGDSKRKQLAEEALLEPIGLHEFFGPLLDDSFTILGMEVTGKEMIGRLWIYASTLPEPEQTNAKEGMIYALASSYFEVGGRVCNQGKTTRLFIAVLQGRLSGVNIELTKGMQPTPAMALTMFFANETRQKITNLEALLSEATLYCDQNALVSREAFIAELRTYVGTTDMALNTFLSNETRQKITNLEALLAEATLFCNQNALVSRESFIAELRTYATNGGIE